MERILKPPMQWQVQIEFGEYADGKWFYTLFPIYAQTVDGLMATAQLRIVEKNPKRFRSVGDHIMGRVTYFLVESNDVKNDDLLLERKTLEPGWWCQEEQFTLGNTQPSLKLSPKRLNSFQRAMHHFVSYAMIPEKGPEYMSPVFSQGRFHLPVIEKVLREGNERVINDLIKRGWQLIAIEYEDESSLSGELMKRKAIFVLGHPDKHAASYTLYAPSYIEP